MTTANTSTKVLVAQSWADAEDVQSEISEWSAMIDPLKDPKGRLQQIRKEHARIRAEGFKGPFVCPNCDRFNKKKRDVPEYHCNWVKSESELFQVMPLPKYNPKTRAWESKKQSFCNMECYLDYNTYQSAVRVPRFKKEYYVDENDQQHPFRTMHPKRSRNMRWCRDYWQRMGDEGTRSEAVLASVC